jgi:hypothetical protein
MLNDHQKELIMRTAHQSDREQIVSDSNPTGTRAMGTRAPISRNSPLGATALYAQVAHRVREYQIAPERVREAFGGVANLYLGLALDQNTPTIHAAITKGLASRMVTEQMIAQEIAHCAGTNKAQTTALITAIGDTIDALLQHQARIDVPALGYITRRRPNDFHLYYTDPAASHYNKILL